ncbi:MAG: ABC transporter substrate-binding protein [Oscillospiraceae bacterium]|nr:ABC transporter substrate-binding protein [Oscillospiraceae bacterium]
MKKFMSCILAVIITAVLIPFGGLAPEAAQTKTIRIYSWNTEIQEKIESLYKAPAGVQLEFVIVPADGGAYQDRLDKDLKENPGQVDVFLIESDYAPKYVNSEYSLDLRSLGLTEQDTAQMYPYALQVGTSDNGILKALSWHALPSMFIYRKSIAEKVLGNSDPAFVQTRVNTWNNFNRVADMMKKSGYFMLSGYDDAYRTYTQTPATPMVDNNGRIIISDGMKKWVDDTKMYTDEGYNNKSNLWSDGMNWGFNGDGKVFGYFGPSWFINYVMSNGNAVGDWAVAVGPAPSFWGGYWLCVAKGSQNTAEAIGLIKQLCADQDNMYKIIEEFGDSVNNIAAMEAFGKTPYKSQVLGEQNPYGVYSQAAKRIDARYLSDYDWRLTEYFQRAMFDYFNGNVSKREALDNFYKEALDNYPELKR